MRRHGGQTRTFKLLGPADCGQYPDIWPKRNKNGWILHLGDFFRVTLQVDELFHQVVVSSRADAWKGQMWSRGRRSSMKHHTSLPGPQTRAIPERKRQRRLWRRCPVGACCITEQMVACCFRQQIMQINSILEWHQQGVKYSWTLSTRLMRSSPHLRSEAGTKRISALKCDDGCRTRTRGQSFGQRKQKPHLKITPH